MKYLALFCAAAALLVLAACATLSEDQCRAGDWRTIGEADGANGRTSDFIVQHAKACNKIGIAPVRAEWEKGRQSGLTLYCRPRNAYEVGAKGKHLSPVCPIEGLVQLERANTRGLTWHRIGQDITEAQNDIRSFISELASLAADEPCRGAVISERAGVRRDI